jgi:hypothetical protein
VILTVARMETWIRTGNKMGSFFTTFDEKGQCGSLKGLGLFQEMEKKYLK